VLTVIAVNDDDQVSNVRKAASGWQRICGDPVSYLQPALKPLPKDRIRVSTCEATKLTIRVYPKNLEKHAAEWLQPVVRQLAADGLLDRNDFPSIHLRVVGVREGASGEVRQTAVSGAHYDYNTDTIEAKTASELGF
jgi:hypothetical protein